MKPIIQPTGSFIGHAVIDARRKHLEPVEVRRLFAALAPDPFWNGYFRLQWYYGCRVSEVALVLKEDVGWKEKMIVIRRLKKRNEQGFEAQTYGMPPVLAEVLRAVPQVTDSPWFFSTSRYADARTDKVPKDRLGQLRRTGKNGRWRAVHRSTADRQFRAACEKAGIPRRLASTHVLRHTRATLLLADGASPEDVQFLLGHESVATTRTYLGVAKSVRLRVQTEAELGLGDLGEAVV